MAALAHSNTAVRRITAVVAGVLFAVGAIQADARAASSNAVELHPVTSFNVRSGCGAGPQRGPARMSLFEVGSRATEGPAGVVTVCSARKRTFVFGIVAGLTPSTRHRILLARSRRDLRNGCGRSLGRVATDTAGIARIPARAALRRRVGTGAATALALVPDTEESSDVDEAAENGVEDPIVGAGSSDESGEPDPCER